MANSGCPRSMWASQCSSPTRYLRDQLSPLAQVEDWRTTRAEQSLLILGDPGIGKSAIVAELVHRQPERVLAYHCCRADERSTLEPAKIVRALAAQVERRGDA